MELLNILSSALGTQSLFIKKVKYLITKITNNTIPTGSNVRLNILILFSKSHYLQILGRKIHKTILLFYMT